MKLAGVQLAGGGLTDLDAVMAVMDDAFDPSFGEAWTAPQCAGLLPMSGVWLMLAREEDEVIGFALGRAILHEAELLLLAVRRDARGRGIGRMLLDAFGQGAALRGAAQLHLEVRAGNCALNLYTRSGFVQVGRRRDYYRGSDGKVYDALTLAKSVQP